MVVNIVSLTGSRINLENHPGDKPLHMSLREIIKIKLIEMRSPTLSVGSSIPLDGVPD